MAISVHARWNSPSIYRPIS